MDTLYRAATNRNIDLPSREKAVSQLGFFAKFYLAREPLDQSVKERLLSLSLDSSTHPAIRWAAEWALGP
jgi:hypothetical protein